MFHRESSRRDFLISSAGSTLALLSWPAAVAAREQATAAQTAGAAFKVLGSGEAAELAAIAARIIPTDETPGATEAGVIYFIDQILVTQRAELLGPLREGLTSLRDAVAGAYDTSDFHRLEPAQQDQLLTAIETTPFFNSMRFLTIAGMFTLPQYGGNRGGVGWKLIGFEDQHMWQPPFGFYDAEYAREGR
jgi:gluconate 2-dehydrogenase gamma chain